LSVTVGNRIQRTTSCAAKKHDMHADSTNEVSVGTRRRRCMDQRPTIAVDVSRRQTAQRPLSVVRATRLRHMQSLTYRVAQN